MASDPERAGRALRTQLVELEGYWTAVARRLLSRRWSDPSLDITHPQYDALHHVCERRSITVAELAEAMRLHESIASRIADRLVRAGLAQRRLHPDDRRTVLLEPTRHGRTVLGNVRRVRFEELAKVIGHLEASEREQLIALFQKMSEAP